MTSLECDAHSSHARVILPAGDVAHDPVEREGAVGGGGQRSPGTGSGVGNVSKK